MMHVCMKHSVNKIKRNLISKIKLQKIVHLQLMKVIFVQNELFVSHEKKKNNIYKKLYNASKWQYAVLQVYDMIVTSCEIP